MQTKVSLIVKKLNIFWVFLGFSILVFILSIQCNKKPKDNNSFITNIYKNYNIDSLPWGKSPEELKSLWQEYFINQSSDSIEFSIKAEIKNQKEIPVLKDLESPYMFRFICYFNNNQCVIFKIERFGTADDINKYYENFINTNSITKIHLKKESTNEHLSEAGNKIKEKYELYETENYIIQLYLSHLEFPDDLNQTTKNFTLEDNSDIDIRIYSKKYNPGINLDFFIKH
ncbi:MAG: hypothetical protein KatS3mg129_1849 [Leptospiraceae bacterium]|nr:MAG: hypothetical protein KatS3mg129_1849 [Leptospiraceae bacterium]